jgi:signal transduction histidine kinase/DNA-binding response OmpR family regulator
MPSTPVHTATTSFLDGSSEMGQLIRSRDWSDTPLGDIAHWPQSLRTTVSLCLASNFPINIIWGPQHTQLYNDGYRIVCGEKHPKALGMDYRECWASAWPVIGQPFQQALQGNTSFLENQRMFLFRNGYLEETFFTFSLSPIRDESGGIAGLFHPVTETTETMIGERRTRALRDLTTSLGQAETVGQVFNLAVQTLSQFEFDLPFVALYQREHDQDSYTLMGATGTTPGSDLCPQRFDSDADLFAAIASHETQRIADVPALLNGALCGPYEEPPQLAYVKGVNYGGALPEAVMLAGASARLPASDQYAGFFDLIAAAIGAALARVQAREQERKRVELLAEMDRAKTLFFSNVSHEFRTPLTLMLAPLEDALSQPAADARAREGLQIAYRNAQRLLKLVNALLDFSRIEAGRSEARLEATDLARLTADLASNFRAACEQAGLQLLVDTPPLSAPALVDREMWEKIVLNLLSNAFKFTFEGAITVRLVEADGRAVLSVADTGVGIPAGQQARIFERFHRVEGQRGRSVEGTGIGLALVRELVLLHGGDIVAADNPGGGAVLTVRLPLAKEHVSTPLVNAPASSSVAAFVNEAALWQTAHAVDSGAISPASAGGTVLLAEDNADMRAYISRILEGGGYRVVAVGDGASALAALQDGLAPELLLSDVMMPRMNGFELLQAVRSDPATAQLVVVMLSARAGEEARIEGLAAGADDYLVKPFSARELRARIDGAVALTRQRRAATLRENALLDLIEVERDRARLRESEAHAKRIEARLVQTAERLAFTLDAARIGHWDLDLAHGVSYRSPRFAECFGEADGGEDWSIAAFLARVHGDDRAAVAAAIEAARQRVADWHVECRVVWPDRSVHALAVHGSFHGSADAPGVAHAVRMSGIVIDVTERRDAVEALLQASTRKDEFLAMLAHELRNPLAPISAAAELMSIATLDPARIARTSAVITRQVRHMTSLIEDLLDVSRVTRGLVEIAHERVLLIDVVASALEQARPLLQSRQHQLTVDPLPHGAAVSGDHKRLVQILVNLLNNAAKYTPPDGHVRLRSQIEHGRIALTVEDNGIGIQPDVQARVFDLFAQAERSSDRSEGGLGLGLALVKSLVQLHGGEVRCHSAGLGQGSSFTVTLPLQAARKVERPVSAQPAAPAAQAEAPHAAQGLSILVVDDNADAADMLAMVLGSCGHRVQVEHGSPAALAQAPLLRPDVCLLDIGLPEIDGNELARRLRADAATRHCKLIAITGYGQTYDRDTAIAAGFDQYLVKPVDLAQLLDLLGEARPDVLV